MSIFAYASGGVDQIGGNIILPETPTHLPRFQGESFTLPPGLAVTGGRAFIWELVKPYNGVLSITNPTSETPTINFNAEVFSEPFVEIRCKVRGQPLNFILYIIYTSISTTYKAGTTVYSKLEFEDYNIQDEAFTIDNTIRIEAERITNLQSSLILYWEPPKFGGVNFYKIDKWGNGWEYLGTTFKPSYIISKEETTYRITPVYSKDRPGVEQSKTISIVIQDNVLAKDILFLNQSSPTYLKNEQPINTNIFYTLFTTKEYEDSTLINNKIYTQANFNQNTDSYIDTFWIQVFPKEYEDTMKIYQNTFTGGNFTQSTTTYPEIFWSNGIGI